MKNWYVILDADGNMVDSDPGMFLYRSEAVQYVMEKGLLGCSVQVCQAS